MASTTVIHLDASGLVEQIDLLKKCQVIECTDIFTFEEDYLLNGCGVRLRVCAQHREIMSVPEKAAQHSAHPTPSKRGNSARSRVRKSKVVLPAKSG